MNTETQPAVGGQVERNVMPRAWALFAPNGNYRIWSTVQAEVERVAAEAGVPLTPLYDQVAMDAAIAAERENALRYAQESEELRALVRVLRDALAGIEERYNPDTLCDDILRVT